MTVSPGLTPSGAAGSLDPRIAHSPGRVGDGLQPETDPVGGRKSGFVRTGEVGAIRLKIGLISAVVMAVLVSHPSVAAAAEAHPAQVAARIQAVREALGRIGASLDEAEQDLARADAAATRHRQAVATAAGRQAVLGKAVSGRASAMYTMGPASMLETILGSESIDDFMARFSYLDQIRS